MLSAILKPRTAGTIAATDRPIKNPGLLPGLGTPGGSGGGTGGNRKFALRKRGPRSPIMGKAVEEAPRPPPNPGPAAPVAAANASPPAVGGTVVSVEGAPGGVSAPGA